MNYYDGMGNKRSNVICVDGSDHKYSIGLFNRNIETVVTADPNTVAEWIDSTFKLHGDRRYSLVVGLAIELGDLETGPDTVNQWTRPGLQSWDLAIPPATIQLCVGHRCLIFQLFRSPDIPSRLSEFLQDTCVTFVGVRDWLDRARLTRHYGLFVRNAREIRHLASLKIGLQGATVEKLAEHIFGYGGVCKPVYIERSNWYACELSHEQVLYASFDAYLAFLLGLKFIYGK